MDIKKMFNYDVLQLGNSAGVYGTTTGCSLGTGIGQIALGLFGYGFNTDYSSNYNCCFEGYNPSSTLKSDLVSFGIVGAAALAAGIISGLANNSGIGRIQNNGASELRDEIKSKEAEAETELAKIGAGVTRGDYQTTLDTQINTLNNQANIENKIANNKASLDVANSEFQTISNNVLAFQESIKNKKDGIQVLFEECQNLEKTLNNDKLPEPAKIAVKSQLDAKKADGKKLCEEKAALEIQLQEAETKKSEKEAQVNNLKAEQENLIAQKNDNEELLDSDLATDVSTLQAQKTKLDNIYAELDALYEKYLDKADGNVMQRSSNRRFAKLFNPASGEINEDKTIKEKDIREAINRYRKATEPAQKLAAANNFRDLWEAAGEDITENPTFKGAYNLINNMSPEEFEE